MWLEYFSQYMETAFPRFLSERPWNYKNDLCVTGAAFQADVAGNPRWNRYILDAGKWLVDEDGGVANWKEDENNIDKVSFGKSLRILRDLTGDGRYGRGVEKAYAFLEHYPRTATGNFWHKDIYHFTQNAWRKTVRTGGMMLWTSFKAPTACCGTKRQGCTCMDAM